MDIGFFINYDGQVVQLPVNPEKVEVKFSGNNSTTEIIQLGEINLLKDRKLAEISFSSFFPQDDWFPAIRTRGQFKRPDFYKSFFEGIQEDKKPCRLIITGLNITMKTSVENFSYYHQGGDHEDAYYSLDFKEYRDYHITQIPIDPSLKRPTAPKKAATPAPAKAAAPAQITKGCDVILNGRVHYDSYGSKPGKTFSNYKGKVNFINMKGSHPYHVTTPSGGWLGWVTKESVVLA
jgi:hypothetical protein